MPMFDRLLNTATAKAKDAAPRAQAYAASHKDQIGTGIAKAEQAADQRTGGKYHAQIAKAGDQAQTYVDGLPTSTPGAPPHDEPPHTPPA